MQTKQKIIFENFYILCGFDAKERNEVGSTVEMCI